MFEKAQMNDSVFDLELGKGKVISVDHVTGYPVAVEFQKSDSVIAVCSYTVEGKRLKSDIAPSLFWSKPEFPKPPKKIKKERLILYVVANENKKVVFRGTESQCISFADSDGENLQVIAMEGDFVSFVER